MIDSTDNHKRFRREGSPVLRGELAAAAVKQFMNGKREAGGQHQRLVTIKLSAPRWVKVAVSRIHADLQIDDWRTKVAREAFEAIAAASPNTRTEEIEEDFTQDTDSHRQNLLGWLGSSEERIAYCDQALRNATQPASLTGIIKDAQVIELKEIFREISSTLEEEQYKLEAKAGTLAPSSGLAVVVPAGT